MGMIKCPECQKEISDTAAACPNCGCPTIEKTENGTENKKNTSENIFDKAKRILNNDEKRIVICIILILVICGTFAYISHSNNSTNQPQESTQSETYNLDNIKPGVTLENYNKIQKGMTLSEVIDILGLNYVKTDPIGTALSNAVEYDWSIRGAVRIQILFVDGKVYSKFGYGLE